MGDKITESIKKESDQRNNILEELEKNMFNHNKKIIEYENKAKNLDVLKMKYAHLERESYELLKEYQNQLTQKKEEVENLRTEVQVLRKTILAYKSKVKSLQSIVGLTANDFGLDQVSLATGISIDKIEEYLKDDI